MESSVIYVGNEGLMKGRKLAFLAPGTVEPLAVMPTYDWAVVVAARGETVVSGFHSALEKDVWRLLVETGGNMILVMVRKPYLKLPEKYRRLIEEGRLLIIFLSLEVRHSRWSAQMRNEYVCDIAESIVFPCMNEESSLYGLYLKNMERSELLSE